MITGFIGKKYFGCCLRVLRRDSRFLEAKKDGNLSVFCFVISFECLYLFNTNLKNLFIVIVLIFVSKSTLRQQVQYVRWEHVKNLNVHDRRNVRNIHEKCVTLF